MNGKLLLISALLLAGLAVRAAVVFSLDCTEEVKPVDHEGVGAFHGVLPKRLVENFAGWSPAKATAQVQEADGRRFLRISTAAGTAGGQFAVGNFELTTTGFFKLTVVGRTPSGRGLAGGLRLWGAPYTSYSSSTFLSRDWKEYSTYFHVSRRPEGRVGFFLYTPVGDVDLVRISLETTTEDEMAAQIRRPSKSVQDYIRHHRFPLGLPGGWNLGRDTVVTTTGVAPGEDGVNAALGVRGGDRSWELWSEPFQSAYPGEKHTVCFLYRSERPMLLAVIDNEGRWAASREFPAAPHWSVGRVGFEARRLAKCFALRFTGTGGTMALDHVHVMPGANKDTVTRETTAQVALAPFGGEITVDTRIYFDDEPTMVKCALLNVPAGAVVKMRVADLYGHEVDLKPRKPLNRVERGEFLCNYMAGLKPANGQYRITAWIEQNSQRISPIEELVVTRLSRPVAWGRDASDSPFGCHFNPYGAVVKTMKAGGVNWVRLHDAGQQVSNWYALEPQRGKWWYPDREVEVYRSNGMKIFAQLGTAPAWASHYGDLGYKRMGYFEKYLRPTNSVDWVNYVTNYVTRYNGKIDEYFIWNEPWGQWWESAADAKYFAPGKAGADFAELSRITYAAVKRVNPKIRVSGYNTTAGLAGKKWSAAVEEGNAFDACDIVDWHCYTTNLRAVRDESPASDMALEPIRAKHPNLAGKPVYMSEGQGTSTGSSGVGSPMSGLYRETVPWEPESPADYHGLGDATCRYILSLLAEGNAKVFLYSGHSYQALVFPPKFQVLLAGDGYAHPALVAHAQLAGMIEGWKFLRREPVGAKGVAFVFGQENRERFVYVDLTEAERKDLMAKSLLLDLYGNPVVEGTTPPGSIVYRP